MKTTGKSGLMAAALVLAAAPVFGATQPTSAIVTHKSGAPNGGYVSFIKVTNTHGKVTELRNFKISTVPANCKDDGVLASYVGKKFDIEVTKGEFLQTKKITNGKFVVKFIVEGVAPKAGDLFARTKGTLKIRGSFNKTAINCSNGLDKWEVEPK